MIGSTAYNDNKNYALGVAAMHHHQLLIVFVAGLGLTAAITSQDVKHQVQKFGETESVQRGAIEPTLW